MKPVSRRAYPSSDFLLDTFNYDFGALKTVASIKGSTKKLGQKYYYATVVLFNKNGLQAIAVRKPDALGNYQFLGLNTSLSCFIVGFDDNKQYNAVIQDMVAPV